MTPTDAAITAARAAADQRFQLVNEELDSSIIAPLEILRGAMSDTDACAIAISELAKALNTWQAAELLVAAALRLSRAADQPSPRLHIFDDPEP